MELGYDWTRPYRGVISTVDRKRAYGMVRSPVLEGDWHFFLNTLPTAEVGTEVEFWPNRPARGSQTATKITVIPDHKRTLNAEEILKKYPAPVPPPVTVKIPEPYETGDLKPVAQASKGPEVGNEFGIIFGVKESFGFIRSPSHHDDLFFHFRDVSAQDQKNLKIGTEVEYTPARDAKNGKIKATNLRLLPKGTIDLQEARSSSARVEGKTKRKRYEQGMVRTAEKTFGDICCTERDENVFFHISEVQRLNHLKKDEIDMGMEVEFVVVTNPETNKSKAVDIKVLPRGSVKFDEPFPGIRKGVVTKLCGYDQLEFGGFERVRPGLIEFFDADEGRNSSVKFTCRDYAVPRLTLCVGDQVKFVKAREKKFKKELVATDIELLVPVEAPVTQGRVHKFDGYTGLLRTMDDAFEVCFSGHEMEEKNRNKIKVGQVVSFQVVKEDWSERVIAVRISLISDNAANNSLFL
eukprot:TRINITY_DN3453_c0_g1_i2.p1 TRINITY_DN3453_c0_g1~~TRINITY_DN3453_c0_g1_i2.p1  ORF type:complete len:465 (-),score=62.65 TRINITY_DN3453_c0_g1_i2:67-1461(-)